jgi:hypothetical protein
MPVSLHHCGIIVEDIDGYLRTSLWQVVGERVFDPIQCAHLCMVSLPGQPANLELVQPANADSPTYGALQKGTRLHHLCMQVSTAAEGDSLIRQHRMLPVTPWQPAVLFGGRVVRFAYSRNKELLEFLSEELPA